MALRRSTGARGGPGGSREVERHGSARSFPATGISRKAEPDEQPIAAVGTAPGSWPGAAVASGEPQRKAAAHPWGKASECLTVASRTAVSPGPCLPAGWAAGQPLAQLWHLSPWLGFRTQPQHTGRGLGGLGQSGGHPGRCGYTRLGSVSVERIPPAGVGKPPRCSAAGV